jgi:poly-gamma-glutamate synthesis protein (capsule biosynthesis protein)
VVEKNGLKLGFFAFTRYLNDLHGPKALDQPHVPLVHYDDDSHSGGIDQRELLPKVRAAAAKCDALMVIAHWGDEYATQPRPDDRLLASQLVEAGALAVIGMHPHVVQPMERVARKDGSEAVVAFSIGNLVSNQDWMDTDSLKRDGLLIRLSVLRDENGPVRLENVEPVPIWTENTLSPKRIIQPVLIDGERKRVQAQLEGLSPKAPRTERAALENRLKLMVRRRDAILNQVPMELWPAQ